ncbi:metal ABC transporter substrate-binding protein [Acholeplasma vituli]|uniref:Metal ABC transporter substrate-binding protein n=1 Tax=Paracholeplasma vituli TaxID=69473 RepID=A0ABT2PY34_9MOLU|nr:metal ABC transporter substrate-binding protein [Paracholeplasma vituli]MCU0104558.1 metal ABC transporter substrate-binding protein [Paracholeplasma vituli]
MKKVLIVFPLLLTTLILSACQTKTYDIVVTLYPQYDMVRTIVGDQDLTYTMILPPGVEAHDFEPTSRQVIQINQAKLFIFTSPKLETWALDVVDSDVIVVDLEAETEAKHDAAHPGEHLDDHEHGHDVHYWVSPHTQIHMVDAILDHIIEIDPEHATYYTENANTLKEALGELHIEINSIENASSKPIFFLGHNVFSSLNEEYSLNIVSLTDSFSPDADPTSAQIALMISEIKTNQAKYVYFDPFESESIAKTIQSDLKSAYNYEVTLVPLHSMHNISKDQYKSNTTLLQLWEENLTNIKLTFEMGL